MQPSLIDNLPRPHSWEPTSPQPLTGQYYCIDTETDGLSWWEKSRPIGISICSLFSQEGSYYPFGHHGGGNLSESVVKEWAKRELRGKTLFGLNIRFDIHMLREWGVDLEAQGCQFHDVGHMAALLDDSRLQFSLESLVKDYLDQDKVGKDLDTKRMASYHAGEVSPRAIADVVQVAELQEKLWPEIEEQGLEDVAYLESDVIPVVCEMEKNGSLIDMEKLHQWNKDIEQDYLRIIYELYRMTGSQINPKSSKDLKKLFQRLNIPMQYTSLGNPSFTDDILSRVQHPAAKLVQKAKNIDKLRSKYITPYVERVGSDGIMRYALHQLRSIKEEDSKTYVGTISGRFSSTGITRNVGSNIQQVFKSSKQIAVYGDKYIIRELHIPGKGRYWIAADASQIEYRLFAHYANNPKIIARYRENPEYSFHRMIHEMLIPFKEDLTYKRTKDLNFATIYGAGLLKLALMMGYISQGEWRELSQTRDWNNPLLKEARQIKRIYNRELPEAKDLLEKASEAAESRGYVKTFLGRRSRFETHERYHKALNAIIQGGAADINKRKLVELHKARKDTQLVMRFTVHDEVDGDIPDPRCAEKIKEILNDQSYPFRVPILWDVSVGQNWKECE